MTSCGTTSGAASPRPGAAPSYRMSPAASDIVRPHTSGGSAVKIADVRCFKVAGPAAPSLTEERQIGMLDIYPEYANRTVTYRSPESQRDAKAEAVYVEVESDEGHIG